MNVKVIKINAMKMQHVQMQMVVTLVPAMMDSMVMVLDVQVHAKFIFELKAILLYPAIKTAFSFYYFPHLKR